MHLLMGIHFPLQKLVVISITIQKEDYQIAYKQMNQNEKSG